MVRWERITRATGTEVAAGALAGVGALCGATCLLRVSRYGADWAGLAAAYLVVALLTVWLWRRMRVGLYVSAGGVRIRALTRTRTLPWAAVDRVEVAGGPAAVRDRIRLVLADGTVLDTPVQRSAGWREPVALAETWRPGWPERLRLAGPALPADDFDRAVRLLRARLAAVAGG